jgi:hypothetical protein
VHSAASFRVARRECAVDIRGARATDRAAVSMRLHQLFFQFSPVLDSVTNLGTPRAMCGLPERY